MNHSFDIDVAELVGVEGAIIFANIQHWVERNRVNGENLKEGEAWVYNSRAAWGELFPYLGEKQIRNALERLVEAELVKRDCFSFGSANRTYWYTLAEKAKPIGRKGQTKVRTKGPNQETVIDPVEKQTPPQPPTGGVRWEEDSSFVQVVEAYAAINPERTDRDKAWEVWKEAGLGKDAAQILAAMPKFAESRKWQDGYAPNLSRWLREEGWRHVAKGLTPPDVLAERERINREGIAAHARIETDRNFGREPSPADIAARDRWLEQQRLAGAAAGSTTVSGDA